MRMILGLASGLARRSDVELWMAAKGAPGAAALLDFAGQKYGFRNAAGVPRWGSVTADMTFTRASAAGRWRADGGYEMVGSNVLRFDHDPVTREPLGVLIESAATNLLTYSEFQNGLAGVAASVNATPISDFEGGRTGLALNNSAATAYALKPYGNSGVQCTISAHIEMEDGKPPVFNSALGSAGTNTAALIVRGVVVPLPYYVERVGQKVWRVSGVSDGTGALNNNTGVYQYQTNQQRRMKITGIQVETTNRRSSYIVTGTSTVTRAADLLTLTLPFDAHDEGFTIVAKGILPPFPNPSSSNLFVFGPTGFNPRMGCYSVTAGQAAIFSMGSPIPFVSGISAGGLPIGQTVRAALSGDFDGTYRMSINGAVVTLRTGNPPQPVTNVLSIGNLFGPYAWGIVEAIAVWRGTPHSDAALRGLLS